MILIADDLWRTSYESDASRRTSRRPACPRFLLLLLAVTGLLWVFLPKMVLELSNAGSKGSVFLKRKQFALGEEYRSLEHLLPLPRDAVGKFNSTVNENWNSSRIIKIDKLGSLFVAQSGSYICD